MTLIDAVASARGRVRRGLARVVNPADEPLAEHSSLVADILAVADERDAVADARDAAADARERELDLAEMLDVDGVYGDHLAQRREAGLDRLHARDDRAAARRDRLALARQAQALSHAYAGVRSR